MSHIVKIKTEVRDAAAVTAACRRRQLADPVFGRHRLYRGEVEGLAVRLRDWHYPRRLPARNRRSAVRQLRWPLGRATRTRPIYAGVCRRKGPHRSPQARAYLHRAGSGGRLDQGLDPDWGCRLKLIEIIVSPTGQTDVQTKGFAGGECREASKFLEEALGQRVNETLTAEFHQATNQQVVQQQSA